MIAFVVTSNANAIVVDFFNLVLLYCDTFTGLVCICRKRVKERKKKELLIKYGLGPNTNFPVLVICFYYTC